MIQIKNQQVQISKPLTSNDRNTSTQQNFNGILKEQSLSEAPLISHKIDKAIQKEGNTISLGSLDNQNRSVAHLLLANSDLKAKTWEIIHNPINKNKAFQKIPAGSEISYNKDSGELSWNTWNTLNTLNKRGLNQIAANNKNSAVTTNSLKAIVQSAEPDTNNKVLLGTLNKQSSTVSELLSSHSDFNSQRWNIIHSNINKDKAFTKIPEGSQVYIDNNNRELSWTSPDKTPSVSDNTRIMAHKLDDAVKPFMGTPYDNIDCYTLVVNGLEKMGVNYRGKDSLSRQLLQMARAEGRADNAYFTGEGITQAIGDKVYSKSIVHAQASPQQSKDIYQEMKELMQKGDILSFSLESKGHTGVISQNQDEWTFINSGRLDHSITEGAPKNGVGEETLIDEINNWIKLAQKRKESLLITIGRLDTEKLA